MKFHLFAAAALSGLLLAPIAMAQNTAPAASPPAATTPTGTTPAPRAARPAPAMPAGQFRAEAEAKAHCPADVVVWVNKESKVFHLAGAQHYGKTKSGAYMCQKDATAAHFRAAGARAAATPAATPPATTTRPATTPAASTPPAATPAAR